MSNLNVQIKYLTLVLTLSIFFLPIVHAGDVVAENGRIDVIGNSGDSNTGTLVLGPTSSTNLRMGYDTVGGYSWIQSHFGQPLRINELGNDVILNSGGGNVGIGTISPSEKLEVIGTIKVPSSTSAGIKFGDGILVLNPTQSVFQIQGIGNGNTASVHLTPTQGIKPTGTLAEYVLHRTSDQSFGGNYGRWSFTALGDDGTPDYNNVSGIFGEFGGTVKPTEFIFSYGYENPVGTFTSNEPMRLMAGSDIGNVGFGIGAGTPRDIIQLHVADIGSVGQRDSHSILLRGKANSGSEHAVDWKMFNDVTSNSGSSSFLFQNRIDGAAYATPLAVLSSGNIGIGTTTPSQKLTVAGTIESTSGGFKFPDGTTQTTAGSGGGIPTGAVMAFNLASCPSGWSPFGSAVGRVIVGGGTLGTTRGTALSNGGARIITEVPNHAHVIRITNTNPHAIDADTGSGYVPGANGQILFGTIATSGYDDPVTGRGIPTGLTGVSGGVEVTMPYIQLLYCQKN